MFILSQILASETQILHCWSLNSKGKVISTVTNDKWIEKK